MDVQERIQQFKQMSEADPGNELGHFSLGKAYVEADRFEEAVGAFSRVVELKPQLSKAYQLLGEAYDRSGRRDKAIEIMTQGVTVADGQGDRMPRDAMAGALREWDAPVPEFHSSETVESPSSTAAATATGFACARCSQPTGQLAKAPFKGPLGERIFQNICQTCWREWIEMGTKVINELSLVLSSQAGQDTYDQYMVEFLQLENP